MNPDDSSARSPIRARGARRPLRTFLLLVLAFGTAPSFAAERRVALVIGNSGYEKAPLENPANDAADMAALLRDELGFETALHLDLDQRGMERAIRDFGETMRGADVRLFYFAGHGVSVDGANYMIPVAADIAHQDEVRFSAVDSARVLAKMESAGDAANVIILDACRDNPLPRASRSSGEGLARMNAPVGSLILYATAPGAVALDGTGRNGTFTKHLLRGLGAPGVHLGDVALDVRVAVMQETRNRQVPWSESSLTRRIYLAEPPAAGPIAEAEAVVATADEPPPAVPDAASDVPPAAEPTPTSPVASDYADSIVAAYHQAAEAGDAIAQSQLGYLYDTGRSVAEDNALARHWYRRAIAQGDLPAMVNLGVMYMHGDGVERDPAQAFALFERAAKGGHPAGQTNLGVLYQFGESVPVDYARARSWYLLAVEQGDTEAALNLGDLYSYGLGVERDPIAAREWYLRAATLGSAAGQSELGFLYEQGEGVEQDYDKAFAWFSRSAEQGYPRGLYNLGEMYEYGKGTAPDRDKALTLYRAAAVKGDGEGRRALERLGQR